MKIAVEADFNKLSFSVAYRLTVEPEATLMLFWTAWSEAPLLMALVTVPHPEFLVTPKFGVLLRIRSN